MPKKRGRGAQIIRQWQILRKLENSRWGLTVRQLHDELGNGESERTFHRDLRDLETAGFPLLKEDQRWRVLRADEGGLAIPVQPTEALALLLTEDLLDSMRSSEIHEALRGLRDKISTTLNPEAQTIVEKSRERLVATFTAPLRGTERSEIRSIEKAIRKQHKIRIHYWKPGTATGGRAVDPYTLWFADGRLYLIGWCHLRTGFRTFLVDRIRSVDILEEKFNVRPDFDRRSYVRAGFGGWSGSVNKVTLQFGPPVAHIPRERRLHPDQRVTEIENGSVMLRMEVGGLPRIASWVAGFGGLVTVLTPPALVEMVKKIYKDGLAAQEQAMRDPVPAVARSRRNRIGTA